VGAALHDAKEIAQMDWKTFQAALIRFGWTLVLTYGAQFVAWGVDTGNWEAVGATGVTASALAAITYGIKKFFWPTSTL
jgi:hypothetical protein